MPADSAIAHAASLHSCCAMLRQRCLKRSKLRNAAFRCKAEQDQTAADRAYPLSCSSTAVIHDNGLHGIPLPAIHHSTNTCALQAGHALVGSLMPEYDPVTKISIVPRGNAGGLTFFAPSEERLESGLYSRSYLENQMAVAMGGRVAEELIFGPDDVTTGASGDFQQVSHHLQ